METSDGLRKRPAAASHQQPSDDIPPSSTGAAAPGPTLTKRLREASKSQHSLSNGLVVARLAVVCMHARLYARALASFWFIHAAIDAALQKHAHLPEIAPIAALLPRAGRHQAFEQDLRFWLGKDWRQVVGAPSRAVQQYLDHFQGACGGPQPRAPALLAHAYTQQTALCFGGQRVARLVRSHIPINEDDPGTAAFEFQEPVAQLKRDYMATIDDLAPVLGEEGIQEMIAEREKVFQMNNHILKSFKLPRFAYFRAFMRMLPPEVVILVLFVGIALLFAWGSTHLMQMAAKTDFLGQHMQPVDETAYV